MLHKEKDDHNNSSNDDGKKLDPNDEHALLSQLGFLPGNVICIAARLSVQLEELLLHLSATQQQQQQQHDGNSSICHSEIVNQRLMNTSNSTITKNTNMKLTPAVVKLYPLAARDIYKGGKSDGRAFKGRRRGKATSAASQKMTMTNHTCIKLQGPRQYRNRWNV